MVQLNIYTFHELLMYIKDEYPNQFGFEGYNGDVDSFSSAVMINRRNASLNTSSFQRFGSALHLIK